MEEEQKEENEETELQQDQDADGDVKENEASDTILDELEWEERDVPEKVKIWQLFKWVLFKSRHLFEVEVLKYKGILEKRKFFGQDEIEPIIMVGRRGLLQNRKRNSHNGNRSLTATESDVDKYYK